MNCYKKVTQSARTFCKQLACLLPAWAAVNVIDLVTGNQSTSSSTSVVITQDSSGGGGGGGGGTRDRKELSLPLTGKRESSGSISISKGEGGRERERGERGKIHCMCCTCIHVHIFIVQYSRKYLQGTKFCEFAVTVKSQILIHIKFNFLHKTFFCACAVMFPSE